MTFGGPVAARGATLSERAIGVSSLSKADGLPGIRVGWLMTRDRPLLERFLAAKEQIVITGSVVDEAIAEVAMARRPERLPRDPRRHRGGARDGPRVDRRQRGLRMGRATRRGRRVPAVPRVVPGRSRPVLRGPARRYGTIVGPGHWFDQPRTSFRLGYGWPTPASLAAGLAGPHGGRPGCSRARAMSDAAWARLRDAARGRPDRVVGLVLTGGRGQGRRGPSTRTGTACWSSPTTRRRPMALARSGRPRPDDPRRDAVRDATPSRSRRSPGAATTSPG